MTYVQQPESLDLVERLIGFDTTSRNSNLELIEFIRGYLEELGIKSELVYDADRRKANLYATVGASDRGGLLLSGHTDVVPVDGQNWSTDPYSLSESDGRLYGRGTSDMKSFIAVCLAKARKMIDANLETPIHFAFSYDEEIGCIGVRTLLAELQQRPVKPRSCLIGEPTGLKVVRAHKGKKSRRCTIHGLESHSGLTHRGANAVEAAAEMIAWLKREARNRRENGPHDDGFDPPYTTVHTGKILGGVALNIVPKLCEFEAEVRNLPTDDADKVWEGLQEFIESQILPEMRAVDPNCRVEWREISQFPHLATSDNDLIDLALELTGTADTHCVSFGTEAGLFEQIGIPSVVCGPGHIDQAHRPDEFIDVSQILRCEQLIDDLLNKLN